jgi:uncharacterized membrane protein YqiK
VVVEAVKAEPKPAAVETEGGAPIIPIVIGVIVVVLIALWFLRRTMRQKSQSEVMKI